MRVAQRDLPRITSTFQAMKVVGIRESARTPYIAMLAYCACPYLSVAFLYSFRPLISNVAVVPNLPNYSIVRALHMHFAQLAKPCTTNL